MAHFLGLADAPKTSPWFAMLLAGVWQELQTRGEVWITGYFTYNALWLVCLCWVIDFFFGTLVAVRDSFQRSTISDRDPTYADNKSLGFQLGDFWLNTTTEVNWALTQIDEGTSTQPEQVYWRPYRRNVWQAQKVARSLGRILMWMILISLTYSMRLSEVVGFGAFATFLEAAIVLAEVTSAIRNIGKLQWASWLERYARAAEQGRDNLAYRAEALMAGAELAKLVTEVSAMREDLPKQVAVAVAEVVPIPLAIPLVTPPVDPPSDGLPEV